MHDSHIGQVTDVAFNTFIPYWLATSGEDGVVKMWDIRYLKGNAVRIDAHYNSITSIAWSNTHCDILSTVSSDRSWRAWNINADCFTTKTPWREYMVGCPGSEYENNERNPENMLIGAKLIGDCNTFGSPLLSGLNFHLSP